MADPPFKNRDTSSTQVYCVNDTRSFRVAVTQYGLMFTTGYTQSFCEIPENRQIVETKKEKLDRTSKEKMLASWKKYDQKDMNVIKIKQMCKPQHRLNYRHKK